MRGESFYLERIAWIKSLSVLGKYLAHLTNQKTVNVTEVQIMPEKNEMI